MHCHHTYTHTHTHTPTHTHTHTCMHACIRAFTNTYIYTAERRASDLSTDDEEALAFYSSTSHLDILSPSSKPASRAGSRSVLLPTLSETQTISSEHDSNDMDNSGSGGVSMKMEVSAAVVAAVQAAVEASRKSSGNSRPATASGEVRQGGSSFSTMANSTATQRRDSDLNERVKSGSTLARISTADYHFSDKGLGETDVHEAINQYEPGGSAFIREETPVWGEDVAFVGSTGHPVSAGTTRTHPIQIDADALMKRKWESKHRDNEQTVMSREMVKMMR